MHQRVRMGHATALTAVVLAICLPVRGDAYAPTAEVITQPAPAEQGPALPGDTAGTPPGGTRDGKSGLLPIRQEDAGDEPDGDSGTRDRDSPAARDAPTSRGSQEPHDPHDTPQGGSTGPWQGRAGVSDIVHDVEHLPGPVAETRQRLIEAAQTGEIEALEPIFAAQPSPPLVAGFRPVDNAVASLQSQSGDAEGREILAILIELLEAGFVRVGPRDGGTFVWPYFAEVPLTSLSAHHYVDVYRVLTAIDVEALVRMRAYTFFRVGIAPDGRIRYFSAGAID